MDEPNPPDAFTARCLATAGAGRDAGLDLKLAAAGRHALVLARDGRSVEFPIVSDESEWRRTTVEEAFYAVLLDARESAAANLLDDAAAANLEEADRALLPAIRREVLAGRARAAQLAELLGGQERLDALLQNVVEPGL